jgi:hypothetical protein
VSRYLSYGNLAEVLVNCDDFIMPYLKETGILKGKNAVFTSVQQKYWELYQHPLTFFLLDLLKMLKVDWVAPLMKYGNTNYDWNGFAAQLQTALKKVSDLKHVRITQVIEKLNRRISKWNLRNSFQMTSDKIKSMYQFLGTTIQNTLNKWYSCEFIELKENKFVVNSNRLSERYISIIKWALGHCKNMRVVLLQSHLRLRNLETWSFERDCPKDCKTRFRQLGSDMYNFHITREQVKKLKYDHYHELIEARLSKQHLENREEPIREFLVSLGYLEQNKKVTVSAMREFCAAGDKIFEECAADKNLTDLH